MSIGNRLKELRVLKGLTQEELADRAELSKGFISQVERDLTSPSIATLTDILQCLGTSLSEFFSEEPEEPIVFGRQDYFEKYDAELKNEIQWIVPSSRKMILPAKSGVMVPGTIRGGELAVPGSLVPHGGEGRAERTVGYTDLDINGHMNNTRYMDWVDDLIPSAFHRDHPLKEFTVCYLNEAKEGQKLTLNWNLGEGPVFQLDAHRDNPGGGQERVFSAQLIF